MTAPKKPRRLSTDARDRMGVYKALDDVPDRYHLRNHQSAYEGRDVWGEFFANKTAKFDTKATHDRYEKVGRYFTDFMADTERHHALADPGDIEAFLVALRDGDVGRFGRTRQRQTVYFEYYQPLEDFYTYLEWHVDYPHRYHPVLMAVVDGGYARDVWNRKIEQNDKR